MPRCSVTSREKGVPGEYVTVEALTAEEAVTDGEATRATSQVGCGSTVGSVGILPVEGRRLHFLHQKTEMKGGWEGCNTKLFFFGVRFNTVTFST